MTALITLTRMQAQVFLREPVVVLFGVAFPAALLLLIGAVFPGATEVSADLGGQSLVAVYAPAAVVMGMLTLGIAILPQALGFDREHGILRRLSTTPAHPRLLVVAHVLVQAAAAALAAIGAVVVGRLAFDLPLPQRPAWFALVFVLAVAALLGTGVLIGARVPRAQAGVGTGMLLYFPMLFLAGIYLPLELMPADLQTFSAWTPAGAAVAAIGDSWAGTTPTATSVLVLSTTTAIVSGLATRWFRWE